MGMVHPCAIHDPHADCQTNQIINEQRIAPDGAKEIPPWCPRQRRIVWAAANELWLCEGCATGLIGCSEGLRALHRTATALGVFYSRNLVRCAADDKGAAWLPTTTRRHRSKPPPEKQDHAVMPDMIGDAMISSRPKAYVPWPLSEHEAIATMDRSWRHEL